MSERMSDERLKHIKDRYDHYGEAAVGGGELLVEIDALRAELTAARTVADGEVAEAVERQSQLAAYFDGDNVAHIPQAAMVIRAKQAVNLLTRLSAAKAEAERERDSARADALEEAAKVADDRVEPMRLLGVKNKESSPIDSERCHARAIEANHIAAMIRYRKSALKPTQAPHPARDET